LREFAENVAVKIMEHVENRPARADDIARVWKAN
jgi:hypothetical protein